MHSLLDRYLEQVARQLKPLPVARRDEEVREMRQHLLNAVAVNQERGQSEEEAAANALAQFGVPEEVGEDVAWAWLREDQRNNRRRFWLTLVVVLIGGGVAWECEKFSHQPEGQPVFMVVYLLIVCGWAYLSPKGKKPDGTYGVPAMGLARCLFLTALAVTCWSIDVSYRQKALSLVSWGPGLLAVSHALTYNTMLVMLWYPRHAERRLRGKKNSPQGMV